LGVYTVVATGVEGEVIADGDADQRVAGGVFQSGVSMTFDCSEEVGTKREIQGRQARPD
jgi:hypothetical protein